MKKYFNLFAFSLLFSFSAVAEDVTSSQPVSYIFNITYEDAQDAIGKSLTEKLSSEKTGGQTIAAVINGKKNMPLYSSNKPVNVEIRGLRADDKNNSWSANMVITGEDKVISALPLAGRYMVMSEVPVLKRQIRNGELISESDIELKSFPVGRNYSDTVNDISSLIGRTPVRGVSPNRPIRSSEISAPALIKKNALVQMRYKTESMEITTAGQALADGAKGDVIEIRNVTSKKVARAVVSESNIVDVMAQGVETSQITPPTTVINY